jgi:arginine-tRNA-protein transferase
MSAPLSNVARGYARIPLPVRVKTVVTPAAACSYLADRSASMEAFGAGRIDAVAYGMLLDAGFRRSGRFVYRPVCVGCEQCVQIRVPVERFETSKSQRRCARLNGDLRSTIAHHPRPTPEKFDLYRRYVTQWHGGVEPEVEQFREFLYDSPVNSVDIEHRDASGKLLAVGVCDAGPTYLSSVYFYFDPDASNRSLGTFGALVEVELARQLRLAHYYLGYWVEACGAMAYKACFRPFETLDRLGRWVPGQN